MNRAQQKGGRSSDLAVARLVANTLEHHLNNKLAVTVAWCEAFAEDARLPEDLRARAAKALESASSAAETLAKLVQLVRLEEDEALEDMHILDLRRSTEANGQFTR
jgi:hypothetical protein